MPTLGGLVWDAWSLFAPDGAGRRQVSETVENGQGRLEGRRPLATACRNDDIDFPHAAKVCHLQRDVTELKAGKHSGAGPLSPLERGDGSETQRHSVFRQPALQLLAGLQKTIVGVLLFHLSQWFDSEIRSAGSNRDGGVIE